MSGNLQYLNETLRDEERKEGGGEKGGGREGSKFQKHFLNPYNLKLTLKHKMVTLIVSL